MIIILILRHFQEIIGPFCCFYKSSAGSRVKVSNNSSKWYMWWIWGCFTYNFVITWLTHSIPKLDQLFEIFETNRVDILGNIHSNVQNRAQFFCYVFLWEIVTCCIRFFIDFWEWSIKNLLNSTFQTSWAF